MEELRGPTARWWGQRWEDRRNRRFGKVLLKTWSSRRDLLLLVVDSGGFVALLPWYAFYLCLSTSFPSPFDLVRNQWQFLVITKINTILSELFTCYTTLAATIRGRVRKRTQPGGLRRPHSDDVRSIFSRQPSTSHNYLRKFHFLTHLCFISSYSRVGARSKLRHHRGHKGLSLKILPHRPWVCVLYFMT